MTIKYRNVGKLWAFILLQRGARKDIERGVRPSTDCTVTNSYDFDISKPVKTFDVVKGLSYLGIYNYDYKDNIVFINDEISYLRMVWRKDNPDKTDVTALEMRGYLVTFRVYDMLKKGDRQRWQLLKNLRT